MKRPFLVVGLGVFLCFLVTGPLSGQGSPESPGPPEGALRIKADITGARIFLDGVEVGLTPKTIRPVAPGNHQVALVKDGYEEHRQSVAVEADKTALLVVAMKPLVLPPPELPAVFRAMHHHIAGYCVGTLTVTAETIEYVDDQKKDLFRLPIRTLKSVSRSYGAMAGITPATIEGPTAFMACRIEAPERTYSFWAFRDGVSDSPEVVSECTTALFRVVYRLWTDTLKPPAKLPGR